MHSCAGFIPPVHALCFIKISEVFILHSSCKIDIGLLLGLQLRMCVSVQHSVCASRIFLSLCAIETRSRTCSSLFVISSYTKKAKLREPVAISLFSVRLLINGTVQHKHKMLPKRPWPTIAPFSRVQIGTIANAAASVFFPGKSRCAFLPKDNSASLHCLAYTKPIQAIAPTPSISGHVCGGVLCGGGNTGNTGRLFLGVSLKLISCWGFEIHLSLTSRRQRNVAADC